MSTYLSDTLALERHTMQPLEHQAQDKVVAASTDASRVIGEALRLTHERADAF